MFLLLKLVLMQLMKNFKEQAGHFIICNIKILPKVQSG